MQPGTQKWSAHTFGIGCIGILFAVMALSCVAIITTGPEPILHLFGTISAKESNVIREFQNCSHLLNSCVPLWDYQIPENPPQKISDYFSIDFPDRTQKLGTNFPGTIPYVASGFDPWGTPFIFESNVVEVTQGNCEFVITLRSAGYNRSDENGTGDDLQRVYRFVCICPPNVKYPSFKPEK